MARCQGLSTGAQGAPRDLSAVDDPVLQLPPSNATQLSREVPLQPSFCFTKTAIQNESGACNISVCVRGWGACQAAPWRGVLPAFGALTLRHTVQSFSDTGNGHAWDRF